MLIPTVIPMAAALGCAYMVWRIAWLSDDAFITFRYVRNVYEGHGAVYNVGERVQGFTHPLWFLALVAGGTVVPIPALAVWLGLGLTALTVVLLARLWPERPVAVLCLTLLLVGSYSFREFQTSGLENPLTHCLLAAALLFTLKDQPPDGDDRGHLACAAAALLVVFNRLDQLPLVAPVLGLVALRLWRTGRPGVVLRTQQGLALTGAGLALLAWYAGCVWYYGSPLPNTFYAKVGVIPLTDNLVRGLAYIADFARDEPFPGVVVVSAGVLVGWWLWRHRAAKRRSTTVACIAVGVVLQLAYVIAVGGDFMRGRFLVSIYFVAAIMAVWVIADLWPRRLLFITCLVGVAAFGQLFFDPIETTGRVTEDVRLTRESTYWYQNRWSAIREHGYEREFFHSLRLYADTFGPITIKEDIIGVCGWLAGPKVTIIDRFGLTDPYIASLPGDPESRTGHIRFEIPEAYLRSRGALNLQPDWMDRVRGLDPSLRGDALAGAD